MDESQGSHNNFNIYLGIVVEDKKLGSKFAKIYLKELIPFFKGPVSDNSVTGNFEMKDTKGGSVSGEVKTTNCITAEWFGQTNRPFPPDIVKGEQVLVTRYQDSDKYFWQSIGRDDKKRKTEIFRLAISDDKSENKNLDDDNTYFVEMDTKITKRIRIKTSKSDGESYVYEFTIDSKANTISLKDDSGNHISIDSNIPRVQMANRKGSILDLNNQDIILVASGNVFIRAGQELNLTGSNGITMTGGGIGAKVNVTTFEVSGTIITDKLTANDVNAGNCNRA